MSEIDFQIFLKNYFFELSYFLRKYSSSSYFKILALKKGVNLVNEEVD